MKNMVFLGGTCGNNNWREGFIDRLIARGVSPDALFNPVVSEWNQEAQKREDQVKKEAKYMLYYLGDPMMYDNHVSFYSLLEAVIGLYDSPQRTIVVFEWATMPKHAQKANVKAYQDLISRFPEQAIFGEISDAEDWLVKHLVELVE